MSGDWFYFSSIGEERGPFKIEQVKELALQGAIVPESLIRQREETPVRACELPGLEFGLSDLSFVQAKPVQTRREPVLIERTAKEHKRLQLIGTLLALFGLLLLIACWPIGAMLGSALFIYAAAILSGLCLVGGFITAITGLVRGWWYHG